MYQLQQLTLSGLVLIILVSTLAWFQPTARQQSSPASAQALQSALYETQNSPVTRFMDTTFSYDTASNGCAPAVVNGEEIAFPDTGIVMQRYRQNVSELLVAPVLPINHGIFDITRSEGVASSNFTRIHEIEFIPTTKLAGREATAGWLRMYEHDKWTYVVSYTNGISACNDQDGFLEIALSLSVV